MKSVLLLAVLSGALLAQAPFGALPGQPQQAIGPQTVVATVAGMPVTVEDVREMLANSPPQMEQLFKQNPQAALSNYFIMKYLAAEGEKEKLADKSPLKEQLELMRDNVLAEAMVNQQRDGFGPTGQMIQSYYDQNKARWAQAKIRAIYIRFKPVQKSAAAKPKKNPTPEEVAEAAKEALEGAHTPGDRTEEDAKLLADGIVKRLHEGADFAKLVNQFSDDSSSKADGGLFPLIKATSSYPADLKKAIFALKPGQVSDPIRQPAGFYIIRMEEKSEQPLNEVREDIVQTLRQNHLSTWMSDLSHRFQTTVQNADFFVQPDKYLSPTAGSKQGVPNKAAPKQ
jgi:peptidyl-prolyl cis-trans isomerase C